MGALRRLIREAAESELIGMGGAYRKKEALRGELQAMVTEAVASGVVSSPAELEEWWRTLDLAASTLKSIPFEVWTKLASKR